MNMLSYTKPNSSQRWNDTVELFDTMLLGVSTVEEDALLRIYQLKSL